MSLGALSILTFSILCVSGPVAFVMFLKDGGDVSQRWGPRLFRSSDGVLYVSADGGGVLNCYADGGYGSSFTQLKDVFQGSAFVRSYHPTSFDSAFTSSVAVLRLKTGRGPERLLSFFFSRDEFAEFTPRCSSSEVAVVQIF
jgi:hypothetical protein